MSPPPFASSSQETTKTSCNHTKNNIAVKKKTVLVVKKKRQQQQQQPRQPNNTNGNGNGNNHNPQLPASSSVRCRGLLPSRTAATVAAAELQAQLLLKNQQEQRQQQAKAAALDDEFFFGSNNDDHDKEQLHACDTMHLIRSCQQQNQAAAAPTTCLSIPLSNYSHNGNDDSGDIWAILECTIYASATKTGLHHQQVHQELLEMLNNTTTTTTTSDNQLVALSPPKISGCGSYSHNHGAATVGQSTTIAVATAAAATVTTTTLPPPPPKVLLTVPDYKRGIWDAHYQQQQKMKQQQHQPSPSSLMSASKGRSEEDDQEDASFFAVCWFVQNLQHWTYNGDRIAKSDMERIWNLTKNGASPLLLSLSLDFILQYLVQIHVLLPCYSEGSFQLWLPSWPVVLQAWTKASTLLLAQLKRSQYKERSLVALTSSSRNRGCPIPVTLLVEYLASLEKVKLVNKPSGNFVKLIL